MLPNPLCGLRSKADEGECPHAIQILRDLRRVVETASLIRRKRWRKFATSIPMKR